MPLLASISYGYSPDLNLCGSRSITAALFAVGCWILVERRFGFSERAHGWLSVCAPLVLLAFVFHSKVRVRDARWVYTWGHWGYHASAQDYIVDYIFVAVALVLALKAVRLKSLDLRVLGCIDLAIAFMFLYLESE